MRSISQVITHNMALPLSYCLGAEVALPDIDGSGLGGGGAVYSGIHGASERQRLMELNVQVDHVHLLAMVPPKVSVSNFVGTVKGRTAIRVFTKFRELKRRPYWGNRFWGPGLLCRYGRTGRELRFARMCGIRRGGNAKPSNGVWDF